MIPAIADIISILIILTLFVDNYSLAPDRSGLRG